ncbi:hypothetical protein RclHR1_01080029 [Rhizophagus clarus]|uniref:HMG box domain-containing protein n=1 Tax=Rhizophagus clarus TaxID=94130 RepID=A0A2Z6Q2J2_9GLOM|nr:hypothetical protein RclHR1_01080029 [Rhizophagus clarus]GES90967.1 hypothetical protein GLOIN_2v1777435 [Rhizophagus clarus]
MPKTTLKKQKKYKHFTFITPYIDTNNSELDIIDGNNSNNNILTILKPSFPPNVTVKDLIKNDDNTRSKPKLFPNAFIAYRMALMKEYHNNNCKLPPMGEISKIAKNSWNVEPKYVKKFYESLVKNAKSTYMKNNIQIVLDKHMNYIRDNQESAVSYDTIANTVARVENSSHNDNVNVPCHDSADISPVSSFANFNTSYEINDQEYIKMLEQIVDHLLGN